jgi:two-component system sensor histidine kinase BaeS
MKIGVTHKLFLVILTAAGLAVASSVLIMQWSVSRGFLKFVNEMEQSGTSRLAAKLEEHYRQEQSWQSLLRDSERWRHLIAMSLPESSLQHGDRPPPEEIRQEGAPPDNFSDPPRLMPPPRLTHHFDQRLFLLDETRKVVISHGAVPTDIQTTPLLFQGKTVGYLGLLPRTKISDEPQRRFMRDQTLALALTAVMVVLLAALLSLLLAKRLVRPLEILALATHQLAKGSFTIRVPVTSHDELGQLAADFNALALSLEKSEDTRRQWVADISHELRTPLAILRGEIEALQDGVRQPGRETVNSLHGEVLRLGRLVDDLYQLSLSDVGALTYKKTELDVAEVLNGTVTHYRPEFLSKRISLESAVPERCTTPLFGDRERLHQLFANLLDNALKYTDTGGILQIRLQCSSDCIFITLSDSAPGVAPTELNHLFERLYRVESSRNRATGGAGLGLAICKNIVEAHNGMITAQPSPLGGVTIHIELPVSGRG